MISSLANWFLHMSLSTSLIISTVLYVAVLFVVSVCVELRNQGIGHGTIIADIGYCDLNSIGFHLAAVVDCFFWFLLLPIAIMFLIGKLTLFLVTKAAKKTVMMFIRFDTKRRDEKIRKDFSDIED